MIKAGRFREVHMTSYLLAGATAFTLMASAALAQSLPFDATNSTQPNGSTSGPAGTYDMSKSQKAIDGTGVETDKTETFDKSQTYSGGNGELSAKTSIKRTGSSMTTTPPAPVSTTTTTTTEESRP
jgi:hypothetical protein